MPGTDLGALGADGADKPTSSNRRRARDFKKWNHLHHLHHKHESAGLSAPTSPAAPGGTGEHGGLEVALGSAAPPGPPSRQGWRTPVSGDGVGWPDLFLVRPPRIVVAELKSEHGRIAPDQQTWLDALAACGIAVHVWRPANLDDGSILETLR